MRLVDRMDNTPIEVPRGLTNVVVTETELSDVRGQEGFFHYRQYSATDLARQCTIEQVWGLLLDGELLAPGHMHPFSDSVRSASALSSSLSSHLPGLARSASDGDPIALLKTALALDGAQRKTPPLYDQEPGERRDAVIAVAAEFPTLTAALWRLRRGLPAVAPRGDLGYVADYLFMLTGSEAADEHVAALSAYLVAAIDHGFNASTFTARVIASTGADATSCFLGALGALSGPLHGGAPSRALETLDAIGHPDNIDAWVTAQISDGKRIMGFGHPVYRTEDPRSALMKEVALRFDSPRVRFAVQVEERVTGLLAELKPGRHLHANVEWYAAIVMEICGIPPELFTSTFACARALGWAANILEQARDPKIIRPSARYVGEPAPVPIPAGVL
ncbi:citrate/2-methylcitrate synthase [Amnibacterium sp.]|uniref:citrate/2-methylcitrate synthase n=1 Tax=Amnibacterium sp. TaxID=1872496 RepID=UPI0026114DE0|nr:citrate/2-methylcitrate synthase [Amnibacterium sp.]MCU1473261.1 citrate synthase [Amnibacterium sp.]